VEKIDFFGNKIFYELDLEHDSELIQAAKACISLHQAEKDVVMNHFENDPAAMEKVSEAALNSLLSSGDDVSSIVSTREITNCLVFNIDNVKNSLKRESIQILRDKLDKIVAARARKLFKVGSLFSVTKSGHFLYPPGGFMSWHTNSSAPGWRLYINYVEEPDKSFFRYQNPDTGEIVTSMDKKWNFRLFKIDAKKPFWHTVYSDTNRYSFGFRITIDWSLPVYKRVLFRTKNLIGSALEGNK